jgi:chromate transporter
LLDETSFADLVALCQFLPGPASSQVAFSLGLMRGGWLGGLAASAGFTLPSAIAMLLFAYVAEDLTGPLGAGILHGLKLVAVAIVSQAVWGMASSLCPDRTRAGIALLALVVVTAAGGAAGQIAAILLGDAPERCSARRHQGRQRWRQWDSFPRSPSHEWPACCS